jgi:pimeloyl-ACP methyl ester carboxylesterase
MIPQVQYTTSGSVNIAYQVFGQEAPNLVIVLGWLSNVEESWKNPWTVNWLNSLASFSRVVIFDKRGTGLSDRLPVDHLPGFDQRMDDLRAVMDAADCKDAFIFGVSEGGPLATAFSVTYPERCRGLIIFNSYAKWIRDKDHPYGWTRENMRNHSSLYKQIGASQLG